MTNFLNMRCPKCGNEDRLDIQATVWIRVCEDGTDADAAEGTSDLGHQYTPDSPAFCAACGHWAAVWQFELAGGAS
jgi:hypothetical protein